jgi:hypothetical protein
MLSSRTHDQAEQVQGALWELNLGKRVSRRTMDVPHTARRRVSVLTHLVAHKHHYVAVCFCIMWVLSQSSLYNTAPHSRLVVTYFRVYNERKKCSLSAPSMLRERHISLHRADCPFCAGTHLPQVRALCEQLKLYRQLLRAPLCVHGLIFYTRENASE